MFLAIKRSIKGRPVFIIFGEMMNIIDVMKRLKSEVHEKAELIISNNALGIEFRIRTYLDDDWHSRAYTISYEAMEKANFDIVAEAMDESIRWMAHSVNKGCVRLSDQRIRLA